MKSENLKFVIVLLVLATVEISQGDTVNRQRYGRSARFMSRDEVLNSISSKKDIDVSPPSKAQDAVPLHRYYHGQRVNHHYRTSYSDAINKQMLEWGYTYEGIQGKVYKLPATGTVPLYRYYHGASVDHFYTTNWGELGAGKGGYKYEGIECYIYPSPMDGTLPLYRYWNPQGHDHFYTTNWDELHDGKSGWIHEGVAGYIYPRD